MTPRHCERCTIGETRGANKLCEECKADGWYWHAHKHTALNRRRLLCVQCVRNTIRGTSKLCADCRAAGWRWCALGKHPTREANGAGQCPRCKRAYAKAHYRRQYGINPPPGYVPLREAERVLAFDRTALSWQIRHGHRNAWKHPTKRGWFVEVGS